MRYTPLFFSLLLAACGTTETEPADQAGDVRVESFVPDSFADSVALAHGFEHWAQVERLDFDFVVAVADTPQVDRAWSWYPRTDSVVRTVDGQSMGYVRGAALDADATEADGQFINDSYWVLMPFYLVWSEDGYEATVDRDATMPMSGEPATLLTVAYGNEGGYTPGDAYDLYVDDDYRLTEWVYRRGGAPEPTMTTGWADYRNAEELLLPTTHPSAGPTLISPPAVTVVLAD